MTPLKTPRAAALGRARGQLSLVLACLTTALLALQANRGSGANVQGPPVFPQKSQVQGREVHSFGLAVTQPGSIRVEVRWQGPPLRVSLQGPTRPSTFGFEGPRRELAGLATRGIVIQQDTSSTSALGGQVAAVQVPDWAATSVTVAIAE